MPEPAPNPGRGALEAQVQQEPHGHGREEVRYEEEGAHPVGAVAEEELHHGGGGGRVEQQRAHDHYEAQREPGPELLVEPYVEGDQHEGYGDVHGGDGALHHDQGAVVGVDTLGESAPRGRPGGGRPHGVAEGGTEDGRGYYQHQHDRKQHHLLHSAPPLLVPSSFNWLCPIPARISWKVEYSRSSWGDRK